MLLADRKILWPRLDKMGVDNVRKEFALGSFLAHEEEGVEEWLRRQEAFNAAVEAKKSAKRATSASIMAWIAALAAVASAVTSWSD